MYKLFKKCNFIKYFNSDLKIHKEIILKKLNSVNLNFKIILQLLVIHFNEWISV